MSDVTRILQSIDDSDSKATEELLPMVYEELRRLAAAKMAQETPGQTLQPTALVHEAWLRLAGDEHATWDNRGHFFSAAAEAMRRILVETARRKQRLRHGGGQERVSLDAADLLLPLPDADLLALDEALTRLAEVQPRAAEVVKLCYFVGLTQEKAAQYLDMSVSTAERLWAFARAWLYREIQKDRDPTV